MSNQDHRPTLLVAHPYLNASGGSNAVAAWAIEALRAQYRITLATLGPMDIPGVNRSFGTSLAPEDVEVSTAPATYQRQLRYLPTRGALMHICLNMRWARQMDRERHFDVLLGTENECDFGRPGLQYVHYPWLYLPRPAAEMQWFHKIPGFLRTYRFLCARIGGVNRKHLRLNRSMANSEFVASRIRAVHGVESAILYPPVPGDFLQKPWEQRRDAFVGVGRIHPDKRWVEAVHILDAVRARGNEAGLTVIGHPHIPEYQAELQAMQSSRPWFRMLHNLTRQELVEELASHRYGIHTMHEEHFGIGPAEAQRAGCVTFVHNSGGPIEIVGKRTELTFTDREDAAAKIVRVLSDVALREELRVHVAAQHSRFTVERFCESLQKIVREFAGSR